MKKVDFNLENCYGIKEFKETISFGNKKTIVIYAPNGIMVNWVGLKPTKIPIIKCINSCTNAKIINNKYMSQALNIKKNKILKRYFNFLDIELIIN